MGEHHGLTTLVHKDIPSQTTNQVNFGPEVESLTVQIWLNKECFLLHNIYNTGSEININPVQHIGKSLLLGDFNAHHPTWSQGTPNMAGRLIDEQLTNLDTYVLMNGDNGIYTPTTKHGSVIDLSIVHVEIAMKSNWSIYDGLISDHL